MLILEKSEMPYKLIVVIWIIDLNYKLSFVAIIIGRTDLLLFSLTLFLESNSIEIGSICEDWCLTKTSSILFIDFSPF